MTRIKERAAHTSRFGSSGGSLRLGAFALIPFLGFSDGAGLQAEIITVLEVLNGLRVSPDYEVLPIE